MFIRTTAINKILSLKKRKKVIQGGTSAGKTFGILPILIDIAARSPKKEISVVSETVPHLRRGAIKDFKKIMQATGRWIDDRWNESYFIYKFANGSYIEFFSADQETRLRGARRQILYVNEANNIPFESYYQMAIRTSEDIFLDFNPTAEFWAHTEVLAEDDAELLILTYKDNEALPETTVRDIELNREKAKTSTYWANWWQVYGLGQVGSLEGVIFSDWKQIDFLPDEARLLACGLDFGYTNDPTALIGMYKWNDQIIFNELIYQTGLVNSEIASLIKSMDLFNTVIYADSAEPKSIEEIRRYGINIVSTAKGRDSINYGISLIQQQPFLVTKPSFNLIKELRNYTWDKDKTGRTLNVPIDVFNHAIDAMRYVAMNKMSNQHRGRYSLI
jgi:phage terminase large subunit